MHDAGPPTSYLTLRKGTRVLSRDGADVGTVEHVLAEPGKDIFDGLLVDAGGAHRFVDAAEVAAIHERAVTLALDAAACRRLPEPTENPAVMGAQPEDTVEGQLERKLRRAWDWISGNY